MDIVALLYEQVREIEKEGHASWGNTMVLAAEEIEKLRASQHNMHADVCWSCGKPWSEHRTNRVGHEVCP